MILFGPLLYVMGLVAAAIERVKRLFRPACVNPYCGKDGPHYH